jgi:AmmeMemoRadiSam system protein B
MEGGAEPPSAESGFVRGMSHAGEWYPTDESLAQMMKASFYYAPATEDAKRNVVGIVAPHSCYVVCLRTAAKAYSRVNPDNYDTIILLGTCHHIPLLACLVSAATSVETPFGNLEVDVDTCRGLCESNPSLFAFMSQETDEAEHSLEMQYPIIRWVFQARPVRLIPILVGCLNEEREAADARIIGPLIKAARTLFVISSDFTHWGEIFKWTRMANSRKLLVQQLKLHDDKAINIISQFNADHFRFFIEETNGAICGCYAISLILVLLNARRYSVELVDRTELCPILAMSDFSISYVAIVFTKKEGDIPEEEEDDDDVGPRINMAIFGRVP